MNLLVDEMPESPHDYSSFNCSWRSGFGTGILRSETFGREETETDISLR